jgi:hypothetical protein
MSHDDEFSWYKFRGLLAFGLLFGGLLVYSLFDLVFLIVGREGTATVTEVYKLPASRGPDYTMMEFKYKDTAGNERMAKLNLGRNGGGPPPGAEIEIQYLPMWLLDAPDAARPKRPFNWIVLSIFLLVAAGFGFFTYRAIYPPEERQRPASRRR